MHHGAEVGLVLLACVVLAAGALLRGLVRRVRLPYTAAVLALGALCGLGFQIAEHFGALPEILREVSLHPLSAELVVFVFLPALVFESALSLDFYAFTRNLGPVLVLAVPGLVLGTVLSALLMSGLTAASWGWTLPVALVFGALISATDPVAVVGVLRELGAPKHLGVLIEGESLLNDGTAIVVFSVLLAAAGAAEGAAGLDFGAAGIEFLRVAGGGVAVGLGISLLLSWWLSRLFNDSVTETALTILMAYVAMLLAEGFLHVSGVIAVVTVGLWMAGPGRTSISPGVRSHQHRFWEMLAWIGNTLIFFLAGMTIAREVGALGLTDLLLVVAAWAGLLVLRFAINFVLRPFMGWLGPKVSAREATVLSWGGLRGAVSLALAMIASQHPALGEVAGKQVLAVTAGVVTLTVLVNGSTTGLLLRRLGFGRKTAPERLALLQARADVIEQVEDSVDQLSRKRNLRLVSWDAVRRALGLRKKYVEGEIAPLRDEAAALSPEERKRSVWRTALRVERRAYQDAFSDGTLGAAALHILDVEIELHQDRIGRGELEPPTWRSQGALNLRRKVLDRLRRWGLKFARMRLADLALLHDLARAEALAARAVLAELKPASEVDPDAADVRKTYLGFLRRAQERLEDLRVNLPEFTHAIEARLVRRIALNMERDGFARMEREGRLDGRTAQREVAAVEERMHRLVREPLRAEMPSPMELLRSTRLFSWFDEASLGAVAATATEVMLGPGEELFRQGDRGIDLFVLMRGAVRVLIGDEVVDLLGGGEVVGEMALLAREPRSATVRAVTTVVALRIPGEEFAALMESNLGLKTQVMDAFARHVFDNYMREEPAWRHIGHRERLAWIKDRPQLLLAEGETLDPGDARYVFLMSGGLRTEQGVCRAPLLALAANTRGSAAIEETRLVLLPPPPGEVQGAMQYRR